MALSTDQSVSDAEENSDEMAQDHESTTSTTQQTATIPRPQHPFRILPAELIFVIIEQLSTESFINFALASYPLLDGVGLAPTLTRPRVTYITMQTQVPAPIPLLRMPAEITLHVMRQLQPIDIMRFVVANYQGLVRQGIAPPLSAATIIRLRNAVRDRPG